MPTTVTATVATGTHDGHTDESQSGRSTGNSALFWGSNSSTSYGLEPYAYLSGLSIPRGRHIISAKAGFTPNGDRNTGNLPSVTVTLENNPAPSAPTSYSDQAGRTFFPEIAIPAFTSWQQDVTQYTPELVRYIQELVLNGSWVETGNNVLLWFRVAEPKYTGAQKIMQLRAKEASPSLPPFLTVQYSTRSVTSLQNRNYPTQTPAAGKPSWYQGYRFKLAQAITVSGLYGGASTASYLGLWADNNGVPGAVLASAVAPVSYGVARVDPVVLAANTFYWIGTGSETNHTGVFGLSSFNRSSMVSSNPSIFSEIQTLAQAASSTLGTPSAFTGKAVSTTSSREIAVGMDYVTGDASVDDTTAPTLSTRVFSGYN